MRIVKEAAERRNEILDVAEGPFCTKGYDSTSTNDILAEIGIARGALYSHLHVAGRGFAAAGGFCTCWMDRSRGN